MSRKSARAGTTGPSDDRNAKDQYKKGDAPNNGVGRPKGSKNKVTVAAQAVRGASGQWAARGRSGMDALEIKTTRAGFEFVEFEDVYGRAGILHQAGSNLWLGAGLERMHLDRATVGEMVTLMSRWLVTGSFRA